MARNKICAPIKHVNHNHYRIYKLSICKSEFIDIPPASRIAFSGWFCFLLKNQIILLLFTISNYTFQYRNEYNYVKYVHRLYPNFEQTHIRYTSRTAEHIHMQVLTNICGTAVCVHASFIIHQPSTYHFVELWPVPRTGDLTEDNSKKMRPTFVTNGVALQ